MTTLILSITSCSEKQAGNPLLEHFTTPHQTPPFDRIETRHYEPAFDQAIEEAKQEIKAISTSAEAPDFENTIVALDQAGEKLSTISSIFFNLNSACTNEEMQQIAQRISPKLTEYGNSVYMNPELFARVKKVYESRDRQSLTPEQSTLLEDTWKSFIKGGANLENAAQKRFQEIAMELSQLGLKFDENTLAETNGFTLHITDEKDLAGLPEGAVEMAAMTAKEKELEGLYTNFDKAFLKLYPNFVEEFNSLLKPEDYYKLDKDQLNTELRIFALMRMGITDVSQIAVFLHYSVQTIYNYKSKVKRMSLLDGNIFEEEVKKLGSLSQK